MSLIKKRLLDTIVELSLKLAGRSASKPFLAERNLCLFHLPPRISGECSFILLSMVLTNGASNVFVVITPGEP